MKLRLFLVIILAIDTTIQKNCFPYSKFNSPQYSELFPILSAKFTNTSIMRELEKFETTKTYGEGGWGEVKILTAISKTGQRIQLAFKKQKLSIEDMDNLENEVGVQLQLQNSLYVSKFYGCVGDKNNKKDGKEKIYYIIQEALNFDMAQDKYVKFNGRPIQNNNLITNSATFQQRLKFYIHLFKALIDFKQLNIIHNDIKPQNIMVGSNAYNSHPYIIDFGLIENFQSKPIRSTSCYEFKGKYFIKTNSTKFDVYSMGVSIMDMEYGYEEFCGKILSNSSYKNNYYTWSITENQVLVFESNIMRLLQLKSMKPNQPTVQQCNSFRCIILYTLQRYIHKIPEPEDVVEALEKIYNIHYNDENML